MPRARSLARALLTVAATAASLLVAVPVAHAATTYHVAVDGDDMGPGSAERPYRTINRCAQQAQPGDTCLVRRGNYRETVRPARSGTAAAPITFRAETPGTVTIDGTNAAQPGAWSRLTDAQAWELLAEDPTLQHSEFLTQGHAAGEIYSMPLGPTADAPMQVFADRQMVVEGQWPLPGADPLVPLTLQIADPGTDADTVVDTGLTKPAGYWTGAKVYTSTWFRLRQHQVAASAPGALTLSSGDCSFLDENTRYYLHGKLQAMTGRGTWFWHPARQRLYLWMPNGGNPATSAIDVKRRTWGLDLDGRSHVTVEDIGLFATSARTGDTSTGVRLTRLDARYVSHTRDLAPEPPRGLCDTFTHGEASTGIVLRGTDNVLGLSTIRWSSGNGVAVLGTGNVVWFNRISDVDYHGSYASGVSVLNDRNTVVRNTISRAGRAGIGMDWHLIDDDALSGVTIANNDIHTFSMLSVDAAAVYLCCRLDLSGSSIHHNRLHDARTMPGVRQWSTSGVYLDNQVYNAHVHNNVGWGLPDPVVFLNGDYKESEPLTTGRSEGNRVENNTGGVRLLAIRNGTGTRLVNNLGPFVTGGIPEFEPNFDPTRTPPSGITYLTNLWAADGDPRYVNEPARDYRLQAGSPARHTGTAIPGVTDPRVDANPAKGAYQYGVAPWPAGA